MARDAVLISVIAILIILVVALSVMLTLMACRKKLKQSCLPLRKGRADVHESNAVSALASEFAGRSTCGYIARCVAATAICQMY